MSNILIVDDEPGNLQQIKLSIIALGYGAMVLPKADYLFQRLETASVDLILLDVNMPGVDGVTALRQLKADPVHGKIPVIMLTAILLRFRSSSPPMPIATILDTTKSS